MVDRRESEYLLLPRQAVSGRAGLQAIATVRRRSPDTNTACLHPNSLHHAMFRLYNIQCVITITIIYPLFELLVLLELCKWWVFFADVEKLCELFPTIYSIFIFGTNHRWYEQFPVDFLRSTNVCSHWGVFARWTHARRHLAARRTDVSWNDDAPHHPALGAENRMFRV